MPQPNGANWRRRGAIRRHSHQFIKPRPSPHVLPTVGHFLRFSLKIGVCRAYSRSYSRLQPGLGEQVAEVAVKRPAFVQQAFQNGPVPDFDVQGLCPITHFLLHRRQVDGQHGPALSAEAFAVFHARALRFGGRVALAEGVLGSLALGDHLRPPGASRSAMSAPWSPDCGVR